MAYKELQRKVNKSASSSPSPNSSSFVSTNRSVPNSAMLAILQGGSEVQSPNRTGLPDAMKGRFERLSDLSLDDVRVHRNSDKPAQLSALAYAQGNEIYLGQGQEKHLEHELGHVLQQKAGIVCATGKIGNEPINDDKALENTANINQISIPNSCSEVCSANPPIQRMKIDNDEKSVADYSKEMTIDNYSEFVRLYHEARFHENSSSEGLFSYTYDNKSISFNKTEIKDIIAAYTSLSQTVGPILRDQINEGKGNDYMQFGEADNNQVVAYAGLDSCIGVTAKRKDGSKFGVHLVLPFGEVGGANSIEVYNQRLEKLEEFIEGDANNPVEKIIVSGEKESHLNNLAQIEGCKELLAKINKLFEDKDVEDVEASAGISIVK